MERPSRRRRRAQGRWKAESILTLLGWNKSALTVYAALQYLAKGKRQVNITRPRISKVCGFHKDTITKAMHALRDAGWIVLNYGRANKGHATWYRITLPPGRFFPEAEEAAPRGRSQNGKSRSQGSGPCGGKTRSPLLEERGRPTAPPSPPREEGGAGARKTSTRITDRIEVEIVPAMDILEGVTTGVKKGES